MIKIKNKEKTFNIVSINVTETIYFSFRDSTNHNIKLYKNITFNLN